MGGSMSLNPITAIKSIVGGNNSNSGPSAADVAAATIAAQNANKPAATGAPTLSAGQGMGGGTGAPGQNRKAAGVGANMLTGSLGDASANSTATKKLLGS